MTIAFARPLQPDARTHDNDDVPAAMWRPLFRTVPALEQVSPDARPLRDQMAHVARLVQRLPTTADESALIAQAYQLCERTHGYPAIREPLEVVTRLLSDAVAAMHLSVTAIGGAPGYPNAGVWAGALVEGRANIPASARRFPALDHAVRAGSPNIEFEDVERGLGLARVLGIFKLDAAQAGDNEPFIVLAAAARQHRDGYLLDELQQSADAVAPQPNCISAYITQVARIARAHGFALPTHWRWFVMAHARAQERYRMGRHSAVKT